MCRVGQKLLTSSQRGQNCARLTHLQAGPAPAGAIWCVSGTFESAAVGPSRVPRSMTSGSGVVRCLGLLEDASSRERSSRGYFLDLHAACARLGGKHVRNRAEQNDREDAYRSIDEDDGRGMSLAGLEDAR